MILNKELQQGSIEWLEMRWGKIGGTASKGLHTKGDTLFIDLLSQHLEEFEPGDSYKSEAMERGNDLEPFAIDYVGKYTGYKFEAFGWLQSEENELIGISPDGLTEDLKVAVETKCFGRKKHTEVLLSNEIPLENIYQLCHYFTVNPLLEKLYFCAFRPESIKNFVKELTLESEVNIGTNARPKIMAIKDVVKRSLQFSDELLIKINNNKESLKF